MNRDECLSILKKTQIFEELPEDELFKIFENGKILNYAKDQPILLEDATSGNAIYVILKGKVKVVKLGENGQEALLNILTENEFFGEMAALDGLSRSATIIAIENTEIFILSREDFLNLIKKYPEVAFSLLKILAVRLRQANARIKALTLKDSIQKVAAVLAELAEFKGKFVGQSAIIEKIPEKSELAKMVDISQETINRAFQLFYQNGLVENEDDKIIIKDYSKFKELYVGNF